MSNTDRLSKQDATTCDRLAFNPSKPRSELKPPSQSTFPAWVHSASIRVTREQVRNRALSGRTNACTAFMQAEQIASNHGYFERIGPCCSTGMTPLRVVL